MFSQAKTYAVDNRLHAGARIISKRKRNLHMSLWDRKPEVALWLCGRQAQSTSLITN